MNKVTIVGIGPGGASDMTQGVMEAIRAADVVVGYKPYFSYVESFLKAGVRCIDTGMRQEVKRAEEAFAMASEGLSVVVISSGDAGIYGMAPLVCEMGCDYPSVAIEVLPGISAFQKAASLLGAPIGHDTCLISLSDLMTPWERIEQRIVAAAIGDFVTAIYNPRSHGRYWQLSRLLELFLSNGRSADTPVGIVREAGRAEQVVTLTTLGAIDVNAVDMLSIVIIGNSQTYVRDGRMITPRGYFADDDGEGKNAGQSIMINSFRTIEAELRNKAIPTARKWALLHAIHATADFEMENILYTDSDAIPTIYKALTSGATTTIVTDVSMVASGVRKGALARLGLDVKTYINDARAAALAKAEGLTRAQAGIRLAVEEHPDALFVFGNAPTALMELCAQMHHGKAHPTGIIAAPVGFVHVRESKYMVKTFSSVPKLIVEGRKGGSGLAAALTNSILCYDDAEALWPGRDV